jgi:lysophospholipase L1-like esterase
MQPNYGKQPLIILFSTIIVLSFISVPQTKKYLPKFLASIDVYSDLRKENKPRGTTTEKELLVSNSKLKAYAQFKEQLSQLKTKPSKLKIAYVGDSFIESDLITYDLRNALQQKYGGDGIGFIPLTLISPGMYQSMNIDFTNHWRKINLAEKNTGIPLGLSAGGFIAQGNNELTIKMKGESRVKTDKKLYFIYGKVKEAFSVSVNMNEATHTIAIPISNKLYNKICISDSVKNHFTIKFPETKTILYGISLEEDKGVYIDNFSCRGSNGTHLLKMNPELLKQQLETEKYDLIIMHFGINVIGNHATEFDWYQKGMDKTIAYLKTIDPSINVLMIGCSDKASKFNGVYETDKGVETLISIQQNLAKQYQMAFYNLYEAMGGNGSIIQWTKQTPPLAYKDYTHVTFKGASFIAAKLFTEITTQSF